MTAKTIHATQNEDGTYRVVIEEGETKIVIERADIFINAHAGKNDEIISFVAKN